MNNNASKILQTLLKAWTPHSGQTEAGKAVFNSDSDLIYVECGRKFGKSEFAVYCCWLYALTRPGAEVYYLAPALKQARELVWANGRMQSCNTYGDEFTKEIERLLGGPIKVYYHEMRICLPNGSFIKIDGSDNYNTQRGLKPDFVVADEYRDFKPEWIEATRPNMSVKKGKILFITTPPHGPNHAYRMATECKEGQKSGDEHYYYLNLPSYSNDRIPGHHDWLEREKQRLIKAGREKEWRREYMAEFITSDEHAIIPQLNRDAMEDIDDMLKELRRRNVRLEPFVTVDPGNSSVFTAVIGGFNPYTSTVYLFEAIKELDSQYATLSEIWPKVKDIYEEYRDVMMDPWEKVPVYYSPRTPWLARDLNELFKTSATPVPKAFRDPTHNISLIKDICSAGQLKVSSKMHEMISEAETYQRSKNTLDIPRKEKQLINCVRYALYACNFTVDMLSEPVKQTDEDRLMDYIEGNISVGGMLQDVMAEKYGILSLDGEGSDEEDMEY